MSSIIVILVIAGCGALLYLKSTLVKSIGMVLIAIVSSIIAFAYFESLAAKLIGKDMLVPLAYTISLILLFVIAFAILVAIFLQLAKKKIELAPMAERIGKPVCGIFLGLLISGVILTALALSPISSNLLYSRFDPKNPDTKNPGHVLLNADGFVTGWISIASGGSLSGKKSFAALHPDYLDQVYLNRLDSVVSTATQVDAIEVPSKASAWSASGDLVDSEGNAVLAASGHNLTVVRLGIKKNAKGAAMFNTSQVRLICSKAKTIADALRTKAINVYPIGYITAENKLRERKLSDKIKLASADFNGKVRWIDFVFNVPADYNPAMIQFKRNNIELLSVATSVEKIPPPEPFVPTLDCTSESVKIKPLSSARVYGIELADKARLFSSVALQVSDPNEWQSLETDQSILPAEFEDEKISIVRAQLALKTTDKKKNVKFLSNVLKRPEGYELLSLKCNNPSTGGVLTADQLPVLIDISGQRHHPVGAVLSGKVGDETVYEFDYCSVIADEDTPEGLVISENDVVTRAFPDEIWLTGSARNISEFYLLYLVNSKNKSSSIIISVKPAESKTSAGFEGYVGFKVR